MNEIRYPHGGVAEGVENQPSRRDQDSVPGTLRVSLRGTTDLLTMTDGVVTIGEEAEKVGGCRRPRVALAGDLAPHTR